MRKARPLAIAALAAVAMAAGGCGDASTQPNGAWTSCGDVARPSVVQVRRTAGLATSVRGMQLATERRAPVVRRLYYDVCVIAGHPARLARCARSGWVDREVRWWLEHRTADRLLVVGTEPGLEVARIGVSIMVV